MRGIRRFIDCRLMIDRITPAYAGNTYKFFHQITSVQDHPRLCGEYSLDNFHISHISGSPPPMRGIPCFLDPITKILRITPAYAGNTYGDNELISSMEDHPRLCGEYQGVRRSHKTRLGSPPPMRGIQL